MNERERIDELTAIARELDLDALSVRFGEVTYDLTLREPAAAAAPVAAGAVPAATPDGSSFAGARPKAGPNTKKINAPIIGVFYRAAAPGNDSFVEVGDRVAPGQVLCILEAMKLMNEITSDYAGVVSRILPDNGALVSLGEEMFWIEP
jgi:acetyl-CoA carboxylase biotin carboxyl carrier protein